MTLSRREIVLSAAAGGLLAAAGLPPAPARAADVKRVMHLDEWEAIQKAARIPGAAEWIQEIRQGFGRRGMQVEMTNMLTRMNLLMIATAPDLLPPNDRLKLDSTEAAHTVIRSQAYDLTWSFEAARGPVPKDAMMESVLVQTAAVQAIDEIRLRAEALRQQGVRMRPFIPIDSLGIQTAARTYQPVMRFQCLWAGAPPAPIA